MSFLLKHLRYSLVFCVHKCTVLTTGLFNDGKIINIKFCDVYDEV